MCFEAKSQHLEPADPKKPLDNSTWTASKNQIQLNFIDTDYSLKKHLPPTKTQQKTNWQAKAWKNEKISTQLALWGSHEKLDNSNIKITLTDLKSGKGKISKENIQLTPISYVLTDDPSKLRQGCGINVVLDSLLVADRIHNSSEFNFSSEETRPYWLSITIPENAKKGIYKGTISISIGDSKKAQKRTLPYQIEVLDRILPNSTNWDFHLDLWQNPYASARYYNVEAFSEQHLKIIKPSMERLAKAGQKNITTSLIHDPWNGQTYDNYQSMIKWTKKKDGTWNYDYSIFDKWVTYMQDLGIKDYINGYSMIPWNLSFYYNDEASGKVEILKVKTSDKAYEDHWLPFLKDFAKHLKSKNWFDKTTISMDERPMKDMQAAISIIKKADPNFKISLAGYYHAELSDDIVDYSIPFYETMSPEILESRKAKGYKTTLYTCCTEILPNTFTSSGYNEPIWLMLNSLERGFDGYLRWAMDSWNKTPNTDTRFGTWPGGDTYLLYPEDQTSIRFEKLAEGIQLIEKIKVLRPQLNSQQLSELDVIIKMFNNKNVKKELIPQQVKQATDFINSL